MPSLFRRSNGVFYIAYTADGKRRWKSTGNTEKHLAISALLKLDKLVTQPGRQLLLSKFTEDFLASATANYSAGTITIYRQSLNKFLAIIGDRNLTDGCRANSYQDLIVLGCTYRYIQELKNIRGSVSCVYHRSHVITDFHLS